PGVTGCGGRAGTGAPPGPGQGCRGVPGEAAGPLPGPPGLPYPDSGNRPDHGPAPTGLPTGELCRGPGQAAARWPDRRRAEGYGRGIPGLRAGAGPPAPLPDLGRGPAPGPAPHLA